MYYTPHNDENKLKKSWQVLNFNEMHFKCHAHHIVLYRYLAVTM